MRQIAPVNCIRIAVCDSRHLARAGLIGVLAREPDISVVAEVWDAADVAGTLRTERPDVVVVSHDPLVMDGIAVAEALGSCPELASLGAGVLMLCDSLEHDELLSALRGGVRGVLPVNGDPYTLAAAIREIAAGAMLLKSPTAVGLINRLVSRSPGVTVVPGSHLARLTHRERDVLSLVANGHSNCEIAQKLTLSEATVKSHLYHLCQKLGLRDRAQAVILAYETGLVRACPAA
ncbi:DNA-binding response regulator [Streptomyces kanamyceticus]|uniref:DNA-binding response regulator n=1 Tax=Streptomyces kanamyceticus TaxID=1967 RepID=A0A5J6GKU5_STRKN|nr:DNA-binding response regulator [Streptomyces kanamyceticus]